MRELQIGLQTRVWIPDAWDRFCFKGFTYRRDQSGRWVIDRAVERKRA